MAIDLGGKGSVQRGKVWDEVVKPICSMAKNLGIGDYPSSRAAWMDKVGLAPSGPWWKKVKDNAKALADWYGESFSMSTTMDTLKKAQDFVAKIKAPYQANYNAAPEVPLVSTDYGTGAAGSANTQAPPAILAGQPGTGTTQIPVQSLPASGGVLGGMTSTTPGGVQTVEEPASGGNLLYWLAGGALTILGGAAWFIRRNRNHAEAPPARFAPSSQGHEADPFAP